jgi:hypothetical protein
MKCQSHAVQNSPVAAAVKFDLEFLNVGEIKGVKCNVHSCTLPNGEKSIFLM